MAKPFKLWGGTIHAALVHAITEYDRKEEERCKARQEHFNHYALGHYCLAVEAICKNIDAGTTPRVAILTTTHGRLCDALLRAIGEPKFTPEEKRAQDSASYRSFQAFRS